MDSRLLSGYLGPSSERDEIPAFAGMTKARLIVTRWREFGTVPNPRRDDESDDPVVTHSLGLARDFRPVRSRRSPG